MELSFSITDARARIEALEALVSPKVLRKLALRSANFYIMDAARLATKFGLAGRINMICMCAFFRLSNVIPVDDAVALLKAVVCPKLLSALADIFVARISFLRCIVKLSRLFS